MIHLPPLRDVTDRIGELRRELHLLTRLARLLRQHSAAESDADDVSRLLSEIEGEIPHGNAEGGSHEK